PMSDDRDRRQTGDVVGRQDVGDLLDAVARRIDDESLFARLQAAEQGLQVGHARIDEDDAVGGIRRHDRTPLACWLLLRFGVVRRRATPLTRGSGKENNGQFHISTTRKGPAARTEPGMRAPARTTARPRDSPTASSAALTSPLTHGNSTRPSVPPPIGAPRSLPSP